MDLGEHTIIKKSWLTPEIFPQLANLFGLPLAESAKVYVCLVPSGADHGEVPVEDGRHRLQSQGEPRDAVLRKTKFSLSSGESVGIACLQTKIYGLKTCVVCSTIVLRCR